MAPPRTLAACLLLLAAREASALTLGRPEDAPPGAAVGAPRLAQAREEQQDDSDFDTNGYSVDYPGCEEEKRPDLARRFQKDFYTNWFPRVKDEFASLKRPAYLTVGEVRSFRILRNFLAHAKNASAADGRTLTVVNVQLDYDGMAQCELAREKFQAKRLDIRCVSLAGWLPSDFFGKHVNSGPTTCVYNMIIWSKPDILLTAVKASKHDVMMIDTDVMIYHDLFKLGDELFTKFPRAKILVGQEIHGRRNPNTGVVLATKAGVDLIERWADVNPEFVTSMAGDQSAFGSLAKTAAHFWKDLALFHPTEVGQCGNRGTWATHYNCLGGRKTQVMRNRGDYLQEAYRFGQQPNMTFRKQPNTKASDDAATPALQVLPPDGEVDVVEMLKSGGDWWIDE